MKNLKVFLISILALFLLISMSLSKTPKMNTKKASVYKPYEEFGIVTQEDIYPDTIDLRLYTSHGRLKYGVE
jgi:hypothetical protein